MWLRYDSNRSSNTCKYKFNYHPYYNCQISFKIWLWRYCSQKLLLKSIILFRIIERLQRSSLSNFNEICKGWLFPATFPRTVTAAFGRNPPAFSFPFSQPGAKKVQITLHQTQSHIQIMPHSSTECQVQTITSRCERWLGLESTLRWGEQKMSERTD